MPSSSFQERLGLTARARLDLTLDPRSSLGSSEGIEVRGSYWFEALGGVVITTWVEEEEADDENVLERSNGSASKEFNFRILFLFLEDEVVVGEPRSVIRELFCLLDAAVSFGEAPRERGEGPVVLGDLKR